MGRYSMRGDETAGQLKRIDYLIATNTNMNNEMFRIFTIWLTGNNPYPREWANVSRIEQAKVLIKYLEEFK
jgi:hypothetical protein